MIIIGLSTVIGNSIVWFTFGISEVVVLVIGFAILKFSERKVAKNAE